MSETGVLEPERAVISRKLTVQDLNAIAKLVAMRLTETEACLQLDIEPSRWFSWKNRAKRTDKFENAVSRVKGAKIQACIDTLEDAGTRVNEKTGQIDWRAHDRLLDRLDPSRFAAPPSQVNLNLLVNGAPNDLVEAARQAFLRRSAPANCGVSAPVSLPETTITSVQSEEKQHNAQPVDGVQQNG